MHVSIIEANRKNDKMEKENSNCLLIWKLKYSYLSLLMHFTSLTFYLEVFNWYCYSMGSLEPTIFSVEWPCFNSLFADRTTITMLVNIIFLHVKSFQIKIKSFSYFLDFNSSLDCSLLYGFQDLLYSNKDFYMLHQLLCSRVDSFIISDRLETLSGMAWTLLQQKERKCSGWELI